MKFIRGSKWEVQGHSNSGALEQGCQWLLSLSLLSSDLPSFLGTLSLQDGEIAPSASSISLVSWKIQGELSLHHFGSTSLSELNTVARGTECAHWPCLGQVLTPGGGSGSTQRIKSEIIPHLLSSPVPPALSVRKDRSLLYKEERYWQAKTTDVHPRCHLEAKDIKMNWVQLCTSFWDVPGLGQIYRSIKA